MTLLERICRAAHEEHNDTPAARADAHDTNWDGWKSWIPVARAVLGAVRDHIDSSGTVEGARLMAEMEGSDRATIVAKAYDDVLDMIDDALKEG